MLDTDAIDTKQSLGQQSRLLKVRCVTLLQGSTWMRNDAFYRSVDSRLRGNDGGEDARNDGHSATPLD